jgi:8-oxo-dGTP pyrophosphatase MutT (NUDIX family)
VQVDDAVPAATVVLLRDVAAGEGGDGVEVLMLRKTRGQAFGGMWVFPGGRVEEGDGDVDRDGEAIVARNAAVREAAEETGVVLDAAALVPFAHWVPPADAPRRFSTWFFVAALPPGAADVVVDGGEIGDHVWTRPADALARHAAGEVELVPPTWVTLHGLAGVVSAAAGVEGAGAAEVAYYATHIGAIGDSLCAVWEPDAGYESGDLDRPGPRHRLLMASGGWTYERSP